jgi:hypothetical protein
VTSSFPNVAENRFEAATLPIDIRLDDPAGELRARADCLTR